MDSQDHSLFSKVDSLGRPLKASQSANPTAHLGTQGTPPHRLSSPLSSRGFGSDSRMDTLQADSLAQLPGSVSSIRSGASHMSQGSRSSLHSQMSGKSGESMGSIGSVGSLQGADVMGSAQYLAFTEKLASTTNTPQQLPYQSTSTMAVGGSIGGIAPATSLIAGQPQTPEQIIQQQIALQKSHAKQQQELYVNQLYEQLSMLSSEHKKAIVTTLQKSDPSIITQPQSQTVSEGVKPKSDSEINKGKSSTEPTTRLPMFLTDSSSSLSRVDKEHLEQLCKTFGQGFAQNILPMPLLLPSVTNPWEYKTYLVSLEDVCNVDEYMEDQGRNESANVNIGQVLIDAVGKTKASLKGKGKGKSKKKDSLKGEHKVTSGASMKATFESTQSLSVAETKMKEKSEADIFGRDLAQQMGIAGSNLPGGTGLSASSCWDGTSAAPQPKATVVKPEAKLPVAAQRDTSAQMHSAPWSTGGASGSTMFFETEKDTDLLEVVDRLCAGKRKKCVIS